MFLMVFWKSFDWMKYLQKVPKLIYIFQIQIWFGELNKYLCVMCGGGGLTHHKLNLRYKKYVILILLVYNVNYNIRCIIESLPFTS